MGMPVGTYEIEVKFLISDLRAFRQRLLAAGGTILHPRTHETNVRYDTPWDGLALQGKLLRLRQDSAVRLTFKGEPESRVSSEARVREELEVEASDFDTLAGILKRIGFVERQVYEKYRETFQLGTVEVVLDEMPFGNFVELEGEEDSLREAVAALELRWQDRILTNYLELMARLKAHFDLPFEDLTFSNFAGIDVSVADILSPNES